VSALLPKMTTYHHFGESRQIVSLNVLHSPSFTKHKKEERKPLLSPPKHLPLLTTL
jgi:hypothetical protein